jgi:hypothetical protein
MKHAFILFLIVGLKLHAQSELNNRLSFQTGLFHYFFDESRLMNTGQYTWYKPSIFNSSFSVNYQYQMPTKRLVNFEIMQYRNGYVYPTTNPDLFRVDYRSNREINVCFLTPKILHQKINLCYGFGPSMRFSSFYQDTISINQGWVNSLPDQYSRFYIGANGRISLEYSPIKWVTLFTQMQLSTYVYSRSASYSSFKIEFSPYFKPEKFYFPSRFDLSLRFGIGINF